MTQHASILPVILAGGSGSRLWPLSRQLFPKQFLSLDDGPDSLFQQTLKRIKSLPNTHAPLIICNANHRFLALEQADQAGLKDYRMMLEPFGRNTAIAVAIALKFAQDRNIKSVLILASDHLINDQAAFSLAVTQAQSLSESGYLTTFGVEPTRPETGYGYIKQGDSLFHTGGSTTRSDITTENNKNNTNTYLLGYKIAQFVEKPDLVTAESYIKEKDYFWNSGMFMFPVAATINEFKARQAKLWESANTAWNSDEQDSDSPIIELSPDTYELCEDISIDYAIMEQTEAAAVVPLKSDWNDLGAWQSVWQSAKKDEFQNAVRGDTVIKESKNCYVNANSRLVTLVGMENTLVIETADAVLVADLSDAQKVKMLVQHLQQAERSEVSSHTRVYRPWGWYETLCGGERFQVKRILVNSQQSLSLQMHHHRAEHWVVVKGTAEITRNKETIMLSEDESSYIPLGTIHRLKNPGIIPLEIIEVQTGSYLGEDDIVRFEDTYGRAKEKPETV